MQVRKRLTYANVMSSIAVFLVLGGGAAIAANQLAPNSVGPKQLKKEAVTTNKLKANAVTAEKVKDGSLLAADFGPGQLPAGPKGEQGAPGAPATKLFAFVDEIGKLGKNQGAVSAIRTGTGIYEVTFAANITNCVYIGTVGTDSFLAIPAILSTTLEGTSTVRVRSISDSGAEFDRPFYLAVLC